MNLEVPQEVLHAFGLGGCAAERIPEGGMNRHWRAETPSGPVVVRQYSTSRNLAGVRWEHALVSHAAARGWPTPVALASPGGATDFEFGGHVWSMHRFLPGGPPSTSSIASRRIMGRLLGRLHHDLEGFEERSQRPGLGKIWELDVMVEPAGGATFNQLLAAFGREHPDLGARVRRERYRNLRELSRLHYPDLPDRPVHGDFEPWNLLFDGAELTGVLDFDQSRWDAQLCDIAPLLMPFMPLEERLLKALLEGYESVRPLSGLEWELLPALVRGALLWWVAVQLIHWRQGAGEEAILRIDRTINVRLPAFDANEAVLGSLRRGSTAR